MGQDILSSGESGNRVSERLDDDEEIKITLWDRIKEYPVVIFKMIWAPLITLYHFGKAIWTGKVFPLKPQRTITDHGEVVGYLDGDWSVFVGRRMALPFVLIFAGIKFWDLVGFLFVAIIVAQILAWTGVIAPPADGFTAFFWVSLGALSLSVMTESFYVLYKHRTVGLWDLLQLLNLNRIWETDTETTQTLYDETLAVKVKRGTEEFAGKISKISRKK